MDDALTWHDAVLLAGALAGAILTAVALGYGLWRLPPLRWFRRQIQEELDRHALRRARLATRDALDEALEPIKNQLVTNGGTSLRDAVNRIEEIGRKHLESAESRDLKLTSHETLIATLEARMLVIERARPVLDEHGRQLEEMHTRVRRVEQWVDEEGTSG